MASDLKRRVLELEGRIAPQQIVLIACGDEDFQKIQDEFYSKESRPKNDLVLFHRIPEPKPLPKEYAKGGEMVQ